MAQQSRDLIDAMYVEAKAAQPITGRGIGYKLFSRGLIDSMADSNMQTIYRLLRIAREQGTIPWEWIVDETRELERTSTWKVSNMPVRLSRAIAAISGISNRFAARYGAKRALCAAC